MAILRSLRKLAQKTASSRTFFLSSPNPTSLRSLRSSIFLPRSSHLLSHPLPQSDHPFHGPLFLSYPPWKLLQFATPLYLQSDVFAIPKVRALDLLRKRSFPVKLGLQSVNSELNLGEVKYPGTVRDGLVESFVNWPNLISMSRLVSGPVLGWMIMHEMYLPAFIGLAVSGATDWLDGYVARKMGINSVVGSYLDPLADKVLIGCVALAMVEKGLLHSGLVALIVTRDVALIAAAAYKRASDLGSEWKGWSEFFNLDGTCPQKVEPLLVSKVNTCFQLVLVTAGLLQPEFGTQDTELYITYLSWLVASTTVASTAAYGAQHLRMR